MEQVEQEQNDTAQLANSNEEVKNKVEENADMTDESEIESEKSPPKPQISRIEQAILDNLPEGLNEIKPSEVSLIN